MFVQQQYIYIYIWDQIRQATDNLLTALLILSGILDTAADFIRNIYCDTAKNIWPSTNLGAPKYLILAEH